MTPDQYAAVIDASWNLAENGLDALTVNDIAARAGIPFCEVHSLFPEKKHIFMALFQDLRDRVNPTLPLVSSVNAPQAEDDLYFDAVMMYLDGATPYKKAIHRLAQDALRKPIPYVAFIPTLQDFSNNLREKYYSFEAFSCGVNLLHQWAYQALLTRVVYVWLDDDTFDSAKTMASLDQGIKMIASYLNQAPSS